MSSISNLNRMSGLMSGLDTEALIKAMTANTKARIDSQKQKLQLLQWRQESYRSVISKISEFKSKYLDILSPTSIKAQAVMNKYTATSSNEKLITATASSGAGGKYTISKATAAKAASFTTDTTDGASAASGGITLDFSKNVAGKYNAITMTVDGTEKTFTFKSGADAEESKANFLKAVNNTFKDVLGEGKKFEFKEGTTTLMYNSNDNVEHTFSINRNVIGVGLSNNTSNKITSSSTLGSISFARELKSENGKYNININGVNFEFDNNTTISEMIETINTSKAGARLSFNSISQTFTLEASATGASSKLDIYQKNGNLLNALFNWDDERGTVTYADKVDITYEQFEPAGVMLNTTLSDKLKTGFAEDDADSKFKMEYEYDGQIYEFEMDLRAAGLVKNESGGPDFEYTDEEIARAFNDAFKDAFMAKYEEENGTPFIYTIDDIFEYEREFNDGKLDMLRINSTDSGVAFVDNDYLGGVTNRKVYTAKSDYNFGDLQLIFNVDGGDPIIVTNEDGITIKDLVDKGVFKFQNGTLIANGNITTEDPATLEFLNKYFGKTSLQAAKDGEVQSEHGENASITVSSDGKTFKTYENASNFFTFDGTTIDISNAGEFNAESEEEYITIEIERDTSALKDLIKDFVNDYNTLLSDLYGETATSRPKKNKEYYNPLTDDQKEEMSDKEIEKWEEQAKIGLLYNDRNVNTFLSNLRGAMSTYVNGFGLADMGISLTKDWRDNGKLEIDESALELAIDTYADKIADFFTKTSTGLAASLENVVDNAISTTTNKYGYLSALAGIEGTKTNEDNQIYRQMKSIQDIIDRLTEKYENEQSRYWNKFTALETYMARMQSQMSYFTDNSTSGY